jgi:carboxyl-terminal processing protease
MIHKALLGPVGSTVKLDLLNEKKRWIHAEINRRSIPGAPVKFGLIPTIYANFQKDILNQGQNKKIGVLRYNIWMLPVSKDIDAAVDEMRTMDGIIIDLRGNLGGVMGMLMGVAGHFFEDPAILGTVKMRQAELRLAANPRLVNAAGKRVVPFQGPLAILVDEISLSASEVFAGGMQDLGRARVFGQKTTGQALPAMFDRLPNGDTLMHAMGDYITGSGKRLEGKGVIPDQIVELNPKSLASGKDTVLETAVNWILTAKKP